MKIHQDTSLLPKHCNCCCTITYLQIQTTKRSKNCVCMCRNVKTDLVAKYDMN